MCKFTFSKPSSLNLHGLVSLLHKNVILSRLTHAHSQYTLKVAIMLLAVSLTIRL